MTAPQARPPDVVDGRVVSIRPGRPSPLDPGSDGARPTALWPTHPAVRDRAPRRREVTGEMLAAGALTILALVALMMAAVGLASDLGAGLGDGFAALGWTLGVGVVLVIVARFTHVRSGAVAGAARTAVSARGRRVTTHSNTREIRLTRLHEAGHGLMARKLGGRIVEMKVFADGSGYTISEFPAEIDGIERAALAYAGGLAAGEPLGSYACSGDLHTAKDAIRRAYTSNGRAWAHRRARGMARRAVGHGLLMPRGDIERLAKRVEGPR